MTGRNEPPPTSRRQHGPDRIEHPSRVRRPGAAHPTLSRDQRSDHHPLRVRRIVLPIVMRTAMLRPGGLAPRHRLDPAVMAVAPEGEPGAPRQVPEHGADLDPGRRLAGAQENRHRPAALDMADVDREKAARVVKGVEQRQLLVAVHRVAGVVDVARDRRRRGREGAAEDVDQGTRPTSLSEGAFSNRLMVGREQRSRPLSGARPTASLNSGSVRRSSQSSASS